MKYVIDHFEEQFAVCEAEDGITVDIEKTKIPKQAKVGDVIILVNGMYKVDKQETERLRKEIDDLMDDVWED